MSAFQRIKPGHYETSDGRFEVRYDEAKRQWFVAANDPEAESALRATAHLRGYPRLGDADSWILGSVYPTCAVQAARATDRTPRRVTRSGGRVARADVAQEPA